VKPRRWKRLLVGWVLINLALNVPAGAQWVDYYVYDYVPYHPSGYSSGDDGPDGKPWMLIAGLSSTVLSGGSLGGCTLNQ